MYFCIQGNICPYFVFALVVSGQIKDWANSNVLHNLSLNVTFPGCIQEGANLFESEEGQK